MPSYKINDEFCNDMYMSDMTIIKKERIKSDKLWTLGRHIP